MGEFDLNLSTQPFPAHRPTRLLLGIILATLGILSAWQLVGFFNFTSMAGEIRSEEQELRVESAGLGGRLSELQTRLDRPEIAAKLNEIEFLNGLIARKSFSWTRLFSSLENMVPGSVHLLSLRPALTQDGTYQMQIDVRGRNIEEVTRFVEALERSPAFADVIIATEQKHDASAMAEVDVALSVKYLPERTP